MAKNTIRNRNMELSRTDHVKVTYFPCLERKGYHRKWEVDVIYFDVSKIFYFSLYMSHAETWQFGPAETATGGGGGGG